MKRLPQTRTIRESAERMMEPGIDLPVALAWFVSATIHRSQLSAVPAFTMDTALAYINNCHEQLRYLEYGSTV